MSRARAAGISVAVAAVLAGALREALRRLPVPPDREAVSLDGLGDPIDIRIDRWGVPHVDATTIEDAYLAQGYLHARDRFWQMDLHRRVAAGRLAEVFGPPALEVDRFTRGLGFMDAAREESVHLDAVTRRILDAYTRGVNAYLDRHRRPLEHLLLASRPARWTALDSLAFNRFISWVQSPAWISQLVRGRLIARLGAQRAAALECPTELPGERGARLAPEHHGWRGAAFPAFAFGGSNAWAVSGDRSETGRPLLAADPHVPPQMPPAWYVAHLRAPGLNVIGASMPGAPGIAIGHNDRIAWGVTNVLAASQDLVIERPEDVRSKPDTIRVRFRKAVPSPRRWTANGPVLNGSLGIPADGAPIALKTAFAGHEGPLRTVLEINRANDWNAFLSGLSHLCAPCLNFVYADTAGNIGYKLAGLVPVRRAGDGRLPQAGGGRDPWQDMVAFGDLPETLNPESGFVVSANNQPPHDGADCVTADWADESRWRRICELVAGRTSHSLETMAAIQRDFRSRVGKQVADRLAAAPVDDPSLASAIAELRAWDGSMAEGSVAASLYAAFRWALIRRANADLDAESLGYVLGQGPHPALAPTSVFYFRGSSLLLALLDRASHAILATAMVDALDDLRRRRGPDRRRWQWGSLHQVEFRHAPGAGSRILDRGLGLSRGPIPIGGDADTVAQAGVDPWTPYRVGGYSVAYRQIIDVGDWDRCRFTLSGGQSGHPGSRHYDDLLARFRLGEYAPLLFSKPAITAATEGRIRLEPRSG
jgi:penicillin amidase